MFVLGSCCRKMWIFSLRISDWSEKVRRPVKTEDFTVLSVTANSM